jgi:hypothetical protein
MLNYGYLASIVFDKFLSTSMQDRVVITDQRLEQHYQTWKSTRFLDKPLRRSGCESSEKISPKPFLKKSSKNGLIRKSADKK